MIFAPNNANRSTSGFVLDTTADTVLVPTVVQGSRVTVDSIRVACDGTSTPITIWYDTGTAIINIAKAHPVQANDEYDIKDINIFLRTGWSLKCKAGTANHLDITVVFFESSANQGSNSPG